MSRKFKLEIDLDSKHSQQDLATMLHTIARDFDVALVYSLDKLGPAEVRDNKGNVIGFWIYE